ncbi:hypothetical protein EMIT0P12_10491 [Pseudomonas sp. IT-P12]
MIIPSLTESYPPAFDFNDVLLTYAIT